MAQESADQLPGCPHSPMCARHTRNTSRTGKGWRTWRAGALLRARNADSWGKRAHNTVARTSLPGCACPHLPHTFFG